MKTDDLTGRTVVVTGAASGIGREIALLAARRAPTSRSATSTSVGWRRPRRTPGAWVAAY
ncbi:MAG TPA: hypothetical protein VH231_01120 [Solirubrobacteraceae bacterium]|jgi:NADPH:quinone reductase-like Zn-dependent oxidoreductase|nr:hypothetical protein [Solirubrobacteraceae bacterium]